LIGNFFVGSLAIFLLAWSPNYWVTLVLYGVSALALDAYNVGTVVMNESGNASTNNFG